MRVHNHSWMNNVDNIISCVHQANKESHMCALLVLLILKWQPPRLHLVSTNLTKLNNGLWSPARVDHQAHRSRDFVNWIAVSCAVFLASIGSCVITVHRGLWLCSRIQLGFQCVLGVSGFENFLAVRNGQQDIRIIQEFKGDLIRTVRRTVRSLRYCLQESWITIRGNSADFTGILLILYQVLWYDGAA